MVDPPLPKSTDPPGRSTGDVTKDSTTGVHPPAVSAPSQPQHSTTVAADDDDDSDPDLDDLDDVLDQFSANAPQHAAGAASVADAGNIDTSTSTQPPAPSSSGPGRPVTAATSLAPTEPHLDTSHIPIPQGPSKGESEEDFMARLTKEMSSIMSKMADDPSISDEATPEDIAKMGKELEDFTYKMEAEGIRPEDLLRAIMGDEVGGNLTKSLGEERDRRASSSASQQPNLGDLVGGGGVASTSTTKSPPASTTTARAGTAPTSKSKSPTGAGRGSSSSGGKSFEDTIRKTMARMEDSNTKATSATQQSSTNPLAGEEDMIAEMLKALESGGGGKPGDPASTDDLSKMFLGMMEQLTSKEMLYEPMKELDTQFPQWLQDNKPPKIPRAEFERYSRQQTLVGEIVAKYEDKTYSDDDPACREFVWERMQKMQAEGAPPEELVADPLGFGVPGLGGGGSAGGAGGAGGGGAMDAKALEALEEGCPTQ